VVFDSQGRGPYAGVGDGRVMRWDGDEKGWVEFAVVIPNRTEVCDQPQPLRANIAYEPICGRPLGLRFNKQTGDLYIADAYMGLLKVGPEGGVAELLTNKADDGQKFTFTNDLDIDDDGTVYFTDSSSKYPRKNFVLPILEAESGGRLLKWDPKTKETTMLVRNLRFPNGVAFNKDHSFLAIAETGVGRVSRYWVKGPKAGTHDEDWIWMAGYPDNIRANDKGEFWVAIHCRRTFVDMFFKTRPALKHAFLKLPISMKVLYVLLSGKQIGLMYKYNEQGELLEVLEDQTGEVVRVISEVEEHDGKLYIGSVLLPHVAVYTLPK
jgi:sugar lactone lactonase YvrE